MSSASALTAEAGATARGWEAELRLGFVARDGATICERRLQRGPLAVQRPLAPEGREVSHVMVLHPPGGVVGGDRLRIDVDVAAGATLEWLPHETILYDGAISSLSTRVELAPGARFIGTDVVCFGLPARGEAFARGRCRQRFELWHTSEAGDASGARPLLLERGDFDGAAPVHAARWGLRGAPVMGLLVATAPATTVLDQGALLDAIRARAAELPAGDLGATTRLQPANSAPIICVRYLGGSAERAAYFLRDAWRLLRPALLGRAAVNPRIWST